MGINSRGEGLWLTDLVLGMHSVTDWTTQNWLFGILYGVSCLVLMLSSCIWGRGGGVGHQKHLHGGNGFLDVNLPRPKCVSQGTGIVSNTDVISVALQYRY